LYFETGSSYISATNGDISTKFGLLIDFDILKAVTSTDTKPEVHWKLASVQREFGYNAATLLAVIWLGATFQPQYQQLAVMRDERYAIHPHCVTRDDGMQH